MSANFAVRDNRLLVFFSGIPSFVVEVVFYDSCQMGSFYNNVFMSRSLLLLSFI